MKTVFQPFNRFIDPVDVTVQKGNLKPDNVIIRRVDSGLALVVDKATAQALIAAIVSELGLTDPCAGCPNKAPTPKRRPHGAQGYKGNGAHKWEEVTVDAKGAGHTYRLRVPGGWLYRTVTVNAKGDDAVAQSFVPMPDTVGYAI